MRSWVLKNIGLSEHAIICCKDSEIGKTIAAWSLRMPRSSISYSSDEQLMLTVDLPKGGSFRLAAAIDGLNTDTEVGFLSTQVYGNWVFPAELWDAKYQRWKCPKKRLDVWIDQLE
jgi:hypothetical protein